MMGLSIRDVGEAERTTAMGLHQSVYSIGMFTGPWLSGILAASLGIPAMFLITGIASLALGQLGIWVLFRRPARQPVPAGGRTRRKPEYRVFYIPVRWRRLWTAFPHFYSNRCGLDKSGLSPQARLYPTPGQRRMNLGIGRIRFDLLAQGVDVGA